MSRLLAAITLPLSIALTIIVTIICSVPIIVAGLIKLLVPIPAVWRSISVFCNFMMYCWCEGLALLLRLNPWLKWDVQGLDSLNKKNWYLLISNHHSWADIVVLCVLFRASANESAAPDLEAMLKRLLESGSSVRDAAAEAASLCGVPKKEAYTKALELQANSK